MEILTICENKLLVIIIIFMNFFLLALKTKQKQNHQYSCMQAAFCKSPQSFKIINHLKTLLLSYFNHCQRIL